MNRAGQKRVGLQKSPWTVARLAALLGRLKRSVPVKTLESKYGLTIKDLLRLNKHYLGTVDETMPSGNAPLSIQFSEGAAFSLAGPLLQKAASLSKAELDLALMGLRWLVVTSAMRNRILELVARLKTYAEPSDVMCKETFFGSYLSNREVGVLLAFVEARQEERKSRFHYEGDEPGTFRVVRPLSLRKDAGEWRLLAWDEGKKALRVFKLVHISDAETLVDPFEWPEGVDMGEALARDLSVYRLSGREVEVKLRLRPSALRRLRHLFPRVSVPKTGNAWVKAHLYSVGPEWVARTLLPALGGVEVISPPKFRKAFEDECRVVKAKYQ
jgi:predicted DNA-binding transcriptional regulator YafY